MTANPLTVGRRARLLAVPFLVLLLGMACGDSAKPPCEVDADCGEPTCNQKGKTCEEVGLECTVEYGLCGISVKSLTPGVCDGASGTCKEPPKCKSDLECGKPSCKNTPIECQETTPICDTGSGKCRTSQRSVSPASCAAANGRCEVPTNCAGDSDCGSPGCEDRANECVEAVPKCDAGSGKCGVTRRGLAGKKCSSGTGRCG